MAIRNVGVVGGGNMMMNASSPIQKKLSEEESNFIEHGGEVKTIKLSPEEMEKELQRIGFYKKQFKYTPTKKEIEREIAEVEKYEDSDKNEESTDEISFNEIQEEFESQEDKIDEN